MGRAPRFCSNACRQAFYRWQKNGFERVRVSNRCVAHPSFVLRNAGVSLSVPADLLQNVALTLRKAGGVL